MEIKDIIFKSQGYNLEIFFMKKFFRLKILLAIFASSFLFSCSPKNNSIDFDFSTIKKSKKIKAAEIDHKEKNSSNSMLFIQDLVPLKNKQEILSNIKFGKEDPFSKGEIIVNKLSSDFKLTGFINTKIKKYAFVNYLDNEGTIIEGYIGGENNNLLPNGAKVISINPKNKKLIINYENKNFIFKL